MGFTCFFDVGLNLSVVRVQYVFCGVFLLRMREFSPFSFLLYYTLDTILTPLLGVGYTAFVATKFRSYALLAG